MGIDLTGAAEIFFYALTCWFTYLTWKFKCAIKHYPEDGELLSILYDICATAAALALLVEYSISRLSA